MMTMRFIRSDRVQLIRYPVTSSLFGTNSSCLSQLRTVVARIRIWETAPVVSPTVTISPTRIGYSNKSMSPLMKLATISWSPKPIPTPRAATSHCTWD